MSENQTTEEEETTTSITLWTKSIAFIIVLVLIVSSITFFGAYTARSNVQKANTLLEQQKASKGAKIEFLLNKREENKKQWSEEQEKIRTSMFKQNKLNESTDKIEDELEKLNISPIK